jgi:DtxR family Mn-dependent transcriptional regulator
VGESVRIARVHHNDAELLRYLDKMGIRLETIVTVVEKAPFKGPLSVRVGAQRKSPVRMLGIDVADDIMVEPISSSDPM